MELTMLVAVDDENGIGKNNTIPWKCREDMKFFRQYTMGKPVIMGRRTFNSLPNPLDGRTNIVLTRQVTTEDFHMMYEYTNVCFATSVQEALRAASMTINATNSHCTNQEACVIGGAEIYKLFLPFVGYIKLSQIKGTHECDTFLDFPMIEKDFILMDSFEKISNQLAIGDYIRYYHADINDFLYSLSN